MNAGMEIALILFLIMLNGLFALSEFAVVSSRKARLEQWAREGDHRARTALNLANSPDSFLSTIQVGITFVGIFAGALGGATVAGVLARTISAVPGLAPYSQAIGFGLAVFAITYLSLIIGELLPKRLALNEPERIARQVAPLMQRLSRIIHPVAAVLSGSTNLLLRLFRVKPSKEPAVTEEEINVMMGQCAQAGTIEAFEQDVVERLFRLTDRKVAMLMTARSDIVWLDLNEREDELRKKVALNKYSFYPVVRGTLDAVEGVVSGKDLLSLTMESKPFNLKEISRKPIYVTENTPAVRVLEHFRKSETHIALVVDEYGAIQGLVTFDDILGSLFEDVEVTAEAHKEIVEREDGSWLMVGSLPLDEFTDFLGMRPMSEQERAGMNTLGGFVMAKFGTVPSEGQHFIWRGLRFEVMDMDGRRVDKVLISRSEEEKNAA